ncbi:DUF4442 domain-containing protein [Branchiibius sp. NY16-3462-2]|uniref:DUF4442 domain-containing protein n=1 Tax=Branchiibius sp. NY16-3462-2 TaxID=1807500 RepID=UPI000794DA3D|nr:DUF4442 domain-containing protein [Branchiibius sp. NY16-3462-2]KYH43803.1 tetrameric acyl-CoA thioesterase [Branchiibius sp. NY16-3462-2]
MSTAGVYSARPRVSPRLLRIGLNLYPPLLGAGIRVLSIEPDWSSCSVALKLTRWNKNQQGTAFGGSIGAMSDAFFAMLLMGQLGPAYNVWDSQAHIDYRSPGIATVFGRFDMPAAAVAEIRAAAASGEKVLRWFETDLTLKDGTVVASVRRQVYARRKKERAVVAA